MAKFYPMREVWNGRQALEPVPYTESGFDSWQAARRAMDKRGESCRIIRGDRLANEARRYLERKN
jgi:hypothetical protein